MKSISKSNGSRPRRGTNGNVSMGDGREAALRASSERLNDALDMGWDAAEEDLDLEHFDVEAIEDGLDDDAPMTDWVADRDFALQIARGVLH